MIGSQNLFLSLCYPSGTHGFPQKNVIPVVWPAISAYIYIKMQGESKKRVKSKILHIMNNLSLVISFLTNIYEI